MCVCVCVCVCVCTKHIKHAVVGLCSSTYKMRVQTKKVMSSAEKNSMPSWVEENKIKNGSGPRGGEHEGQEVGENRKGRKVFVGVDLRQYFEEGVYARMRVPGVSAFQTQ